MLLHMALVRTNVSEERITSIIRMTGIGKLGTLAVTSNWSTLPRNTMWAYIVFLHSILWLLVTANVVPSSPIIVTLMMWALHPSIMQFLQEPHCVTSQKMEFFSYKTLLVKITIQSLFRCVPHRFNLHVDSCVNKEVEVFNRKWSEHMKVLVNIDLIKLDSKRRIYITRITRE
jgi:hypothetical protein